MGRKRITWLEELGMVWSAPDPAWEENLAARAYLAAHGTLCAQPAAVAPDWNPRERGWSVDWQRLFAKLHVLVDDGNDVQPGTTAGGEDVWRWLQHQRQTWEN